MKSFGALALVGAVASVPASPAAPSESTPSGCDTTYSGAFEISVVNASTSAKRSLERRKALTVTLSDGTSTDDEGRTGYIASNNQFQFDNPVQAGALYTSGWSVCSNGTLALGDSAIFYQCSSGTFYNLYDESTGAQCSEIYIDIIPTSSSSSSASGAASQLSDGQVTASAQAISQISDGQIQATTATAAAVSQISDGQIQATTGAVVSQISDGQIQATTATAAPVTQISDGQIQATTAAPVTQISDGQIQASAAATGTGNVSQISDGQIQAPTNGTSGITTASPTVQAYTGAAALPTLQAEMFGLAAGLVGALAML